MFKNTKFFGDVKDVDVLEVCYEQEREHKFSRFFLGI